MTWLVASLALAVFSLLAVQTQERADVICCMFVSSLFTSNRYHIKRASPCIQLLLHSITSSPIIVYVTGKFLECEVDVLSWIFGMYNNLAPLVKHVWYPAVLSLVHWRFNEGAAPSTCEIVCVKKNYYALICFVITTSEKKLGACFFSPSFLPFSLLPFFLSFSFLSLILCLFLIQVIVSWRCVRTTKTGFPWEAQVREE